MVKSKSGALSPINIIVVTVLVDMTGFGMIIPLIPFYAKSFNAEASLIGVLLASFSVMQFIFSPVIGRISDKYGRKPVLIFSVLTSAGSFLAFSFANNFWILLLSRMIAGLASEGGVAQAYIADITSEEERSSGIGKIGAASGVGFILGPVIGGLLSPYGFQAAGLAALVLSIINLVFVVFMLPEPPRRQIQEKKSQSLLGMLREGLGRPLVGQTLVIYFVITLAFSMVPVIVPLLAADFFGFTEVEMSFVFIYIGLVQVFLQGFAIKKMTKVLGDERMIILGPVLMMLGVLFMSFLPLVSLFLVTLTLIAFGVGITNTSIPSFISKRSLPEEQGSILGLTQSVGSIARILGPVIGGVAYEFGGVITPYLLSAGLLMIPFLLGCNVYQACSLEGILDQD